MSKNLIDELYDLDVFHTSEVADADSEYKSAMDRLLKAETALMNVSPDSKAILE